MCYEFIHSFNSPLADELAKLVPAGKYFLVCIGDINYLYCNDDSVKATIKKFLFQQRIKLYALPATEMISVIDFPGMEVYQAFHGSRRLLEGLRTKYGLLKEAAA